MIISILFFCSGCCTKKLCKYEHYPTLNVKIGDFNISGKGHVNVLDHISGVAIDSFEFYSNTFEIRYINDEFDLRGKDYFIFSGSNRIDSITNIEFEIYEFYNDCNKCFLAEGGGNATDFKNLKYTLNGIIFRDIETVEIQ